MQIRDGVSMGDKIECDECDGMGSLDSLDNEEFQRDIRDTCFRCCGSGMVDRESDIAQKRHSHLFQVARRLSLSERSLTILSNKMDLDLDLDLEEIFDKLVHANVADQDLLIAWLMQAENDDMIQRQKAETALAEANKLDWNVDQFRRKSYWHFLAFEEQTWDERTIRSWRP